MIVRSANVVLAAFLSLAAATVPAQTLVNAGRGTVSSTVRVGLVIPPRLRLRVTNQERIGQHGDTAIYAMQVEVAANLPWTLHAVPAEATGVAALRVKDETGTWRALESGEPRVTLTTEQEPGNWRPVRIELQVVGANGPRVLPTFTFDLQPARR
jgi:hypothetical protein